MCSPLDTLRDSYRQELMNKKRILQRRMEDNSFSNIITLAKRISTLNYTLNLLNCFKPSVVNKDTIVDMNFRLIQQCGYVSKEEQENNHEYDAYMQLHNDLLTTATNIK